MLHHVDCNGEKNMSILNVMAKVGIEKNQGLNLMVTIYTLITLSMIGSTIFLTTSWLDWDSGLLTVEQQEVWDRLPYGMVFSYLLFGLVPGLKSLGIFQLLSLIKQTTHKLHA